MDQKKKLELIAQQIEEAQAGEPENLNLWREKTGVVLRNVLGDANPLYESFQTVRYSPAVFTDRTSDEVFRRAKTAGVRKAISILEAARLEVDISGGAPEAVNETRSLGVDVFVVHGRDEARKHEVARALQRLTGNEPIILHEQANSGRTLIEKFETNAANAGFAVVIATGDDFGRDSSEANERPRARQNVIFEMGFFYGVIGRARVALLYESDVEIPSDINGIAYIPLDSVGAWKMTLARELETAGLGVDWSALR